MKAIKFSKTATTVVNAAADKNIKNKVHHNLGKGIKLKILGKVTNAKPAPSPGFTPKAKQAGNIIKPADNATKVSNITIIIDSFVIDFSFPI